MIKHNGSIKRLSPILLVLLIAWSLFILTPFPVVHASPVLIDSYSEANWSDNIYIMNLHPSDSIYNSAGGQSFQNLADAYKLTSCKFYMRKYASPTGTMYAELFAHSGTFGSSSKPTGNALAISTGIDVSTLTTSLALVEFTFPAGQQYEMQPGTYYCIDVGFVASGTIDTTNYLAIGMDYTSPTHAGNANRYANGAWTSTTAYDICFYVYGELVAGINYVADLSQSVSSTWNVLTKWDAITDLTQAITSSWSIILSHGMFVDLPQALTFSWTVDIVHTLAEGINYIVDLSQAVSTSWNILLQWNIIATLSQSLTTTWAVLTQWNAIAIFSIPISSSWLIEITQGLQYFVELSLSISTEWIVETISGVVPPITISTPSASFGIISIVIALAALALILKAREREGEKEWNLSE